jgi:bacterial/archaeal transporter family-2 protein
LVYDCGELKVSLVVVLGTLGAGLGLAVGLAFNLRLARALGMPLAATMVNFIVGASLLLMLWFFGLDGTRPVVLPPLWMLIGGLFGATYVTLSLVGAARLGAGISTIAVTLGQVLGALIITGLGWLGQKPQQPTVTGILSALLLLAAVAVLARDRENRLKIEG